MATLDEIRRLTIKFQADGADATKAGIIAVADAYQDVVAGAKVLATVSDEASRDVITSAKAFDKQTLAMIEGERQAARFAANLEVVKRALATGAIDEGTAASRMSVINDRFNPGLMAIRDDARKAEALRAALDPAAASLQRLNTELAEYAALASRGAISTDELAKAEALAKTRHDAYVASLTSGARGAKAAIDGVYVSTSNVAAQFQDIAVQMAMGGISPFQIALMQGTQLSSALGADRGNSLKGVLAGLASGFAGLLNPVGLATIAIIGLGGTIVQWAMQSKDATRDVEDALKGVEGAIGRIKSAYPDALSGIVEKVRPSLSMFGVELELALESARKAQDKALKSMSAEMKKVDMSTRSAQSFYSEYGVAAPAEANRFKDIQSAVDAMRASVQAGKPAFDAYIMALKDLAISSPDSDVRKLAQSMLEGAKSARTMADGVLEAEAALRSMDAYLPNATKMLASFNAQMDLMRQGERGLDRGAATDALDAQALIASGNARTMGQALAVAEEYERKLRNIAGIGVPLPPTKPNVEGISERGGRSGPALDKFQSAILSAQDQSKQIEAQIRLYGMEGAALEKERLAIELTTAATKANIAARLADVSLTPAQLAAIETETSKRYELARILDEQKQRQQTLNEVSGFAGQSFLTIFDGARKGADALKSSLDNVKESLIQAVLQAAILGQGPLAGLMGMKSTTGGTGGLFGMIASAFMGPPGSGSLAGNSGVGHNAAGTDDWRGGLTWAGEGGPELISLPRGSRIASADRTMEMMRGAAAASAGGGTRTEVNVHNYAGGAEPTVQRRMAGDREILDVFIQAARRDFAGGGFDSAMRSGFGVRRRTVT